MTGDGMCGVFIPDRILAGWWRSQWKASDWMWAGRCTTGCGRGQVYKCECWWDHYSVLGGCLLFLSLCSSGFQDLLRLKTPISVDVIWMHLDFDGFSDETIYVASFLGEEFSIL